MNEIYTDRKLSDIQESDFTLSIIPVSSNKIPFKTWAKYQKEIAPTSEWYGHYISSGTIGIITGKISGNLECIDIDLKNDPNKSIVDEYKKLIPEPIYSKLIVQTTPNGGFHLLYRCPSVVIEKNQKLALHLNQEVIIETRGEGGYFCTNRINNKLIQGDLDLEKFNGTIPIISEDERTLLLETARSLTRYFPSISDQSSEKTFTYKHPAINKFNQEFGIIDLFQKHGWSITNEDEEKYYLLRDGSSANHSGYYFKQTKVFFCFSTSTGFKTDKPYNNFQILQVLEGDNDYKKTLRLLPSYGYEVNEKKDKITSDDIAEYINDCGVRYDEFIQDITLNGNVIEEMDYNTLYINMKTHFNYDIPRTKFEEVIKSHYIKKFHPILSFIELNKDRNPEGTFEKWFNCIKLKNKNIDLDILLLYVKKWYVGMIAQALNGEFPNEFFISFISTETGIGKTTFLRKYTLPHPLQKYMSEHALSFDDDFKVIMSQTLLIVDDEMDGRTYEADKTFKTVLSTKTLTMRRKYDRRISNIVRRCSFAGSGNNLNIVREQQNRRIIPIEIESIDQSNLSLVDLTDLFMEAYHLFKSGFQYSYVRDDSSKLKKIFDDYLQKTDIDNILDEYVELPESSEDEYHLSALEMVNTLASIFPTFSKWTNNITIGKMMNDRGFKTKRTGKTKITSYVISSKSKIVAEIKSIDEQTIFISKRTISEI
jgi:hypothetical protein